eukprot:4326298-Prymnesium_polylepis.1
MARLRAAITVRRVGPPRFARRGTSAADAASRAAPCRERRRQHVATFECSASTSSGGARRRTSAGATPSGSGGGDPSPPAPLPAPPAAAPPAVAAVAASAEVVASPAPSMHSSRSPSA